MQGVVRINDVGSTNLQLFQRRCIQILKRLHSSFLRKNQFSLKITGPNDTSMNESVKQHCFEGRGGKLQV